MTDRHAFRWNVAIAALSLAAAGAYVFVGTLVPRAPVDEQVLATSAEDAGRCAFADAEKNRLDATCRDGGRRSAAARYDAPAAKRLP